MKKNILLFGLAFAGGFTYERYYPYIKAFISDKGQKNDDHSFKSMLEQGNYIQPKVIDIMHSSPDKHFLHNFIAQHNEALNVFKIYYPNKLEQKIYSDNLESEDKIHLHFVFNAADHLQGHSSIVHGGLLATLIDNAFGQLSYLASGQIPTATANLNINYRKPVKTNHDYMITAEIDKIEGRKVFLKATIYDQDKTICTEATGLFLTVQWGGQMWKNALDKIKEVSQIDEKLVKIDQKKKE
ncbi:unnamed protein product [Paramecium octaurelia]|uniref:Thioesterase domain-containing protein n=1 Tax=Paramecium octaurelia TaxID=43137 RepID=A0A8S1U845_PAROT|nr:unnamed protein product [Paramecium octaurelia]